MRVNKRQDRLRDLLLRKRRLGAVVGLEPVSFGSGDCPTETKRVPKERR